MEKLTIETHVEEAAQQAGGLLRSRYGLWALAGLSFVESALLVPIITDPFLIAYILADKKSVYKGVFVTLASSVLGGIFAYTLAFSFYEFIAQEYLVGSIGEQFYSIVDTLQGGVFVVTLLGAVTPIPYTLVALGAGFVEGNLLLFIAQLTA
jgi:membrane protein YqaA with SNARE-associated domain